MLAPRRWPTLGRRAALTLALTFGPRSGSQRERGRDRTAPAWRGSCARDYDPGKKTTTREGGTLVRDKKRFVLSRRRLIAVLGAGAGAAVLAACQAPPAATPAASTPGAAEAPK